MPTDSSNGLYLEKIAREIMLQIKIASSDEIHNSRETWNYLVGSMKFPTVFLTWEWITTWIKHFGKIYKPVVIFIYENDELCCIAPLAIRKVRFKNKLIKIKLLSFCGSIELYPDYIDIICKKKNVKLYADRLIRYLIFSYKEWDVLYMPFLTAGGGLDTQIKKLRPNYDIYQSENIISPFIKIDRGFNYIISNMGRKKRYNLHRETNILFEKNISFIKINNKNDIEYGLNELVVLHKARIGEKGIESSFYKNDIIPFHREISIIMFNLGWLRLYLLKNNDNQKAISAAYGFIFNKRFNYYQTGFDPLWQKLSPGKILISKMIEDLQNTDTEEFDFLGGNDSYKLYWTKDYHLMNSLCLYNKTIGGRIEYYANIVIEFFKSKNINLIESVRLKYK